MTSFAKGVRLLESVAVQALVDTVPMDVEAARARLARELAAYRQRDLRQVTLTAAFERFALSLANRGAMWNVVLGSRSEYERTLRRYRRVLCDFEPRRIVERFAGKERELVGKLVAARGLSGRQRARQTAGSRRSYFWLYADGIVAGARYFSRFDRSAGLLGFIRKWLQDADLAAMLPTYLASQGIPGFGPALAADFLKELGVRELGKPDRWVKRLMEVLGWTGHDPSEFEIQRTLWKAWRELGDDYPPVITDKLLFLVGSGRFETAEPQYRCGSSFRRVKLELARGRGRPRGPAMRSGRGSGSNSRGTRARHLRPT